MIGKPFGSAILAALLVIGACGFTTAGVAGEKTDYEWSIDLDCAVCHQKEYVNLGLLVADDAAEPAAKEADTDAATKPVVDRTAADDLASDAANTSSEDATRITEISTYAPMHAENFGLSCTSCHEDSEGLATGHKKLNSGKEAKRLKKSEVSSDICISCHQEEQLVEKTADYQGLVDTNGTLVNPHDLPDVDSHDGIECVSCHQVHSGKAIDEAAMTTCISCHHAGVFECGTCH